MIFQGSEYIFVMLSTIVFVAKGGLGVVMCLYGCKAQNKQPFVKDK